MFFLSVGMLFDPVAAFREPILMLTALGIVMVGKPLAALLSFRRAAQGMFDDNLASGSGPAYRAVVRR
jgi:CPA2 family monovalent cation:H+ antiporter-2